MDHGFTLFREDILDLHSRVHFPNEKEQGHVQGQGQEMGKEIDNQKKGQEQGQGQPVNDLARQGKTSSTAVRFPGDVQLVWAVSAQDQLGLNDIGNAASPEPVGSSSQTRPDHNIDTATTSNHNPLTSNSQLGSVHSSGTDVQAENAGDLSEGLSGKSNSLTISQSGNIVTGGNNLPLRSNSLNTITSFTSSNNQHGNKITTRNNLFQRSQSHTPSTNPINTPNIIQSVDTITTSNSIPENSQFGNTFPTSNSLPGRRLSGNTITSNNSIDAISQVENTPTNSNTFPTSNNKFASSSQSGITFRTSKSLQLGNTIKSNINIPSKIQHPNSHSSISFPQPDLLGPSNIGQVIFPSTTSGRGPATPDVPAR